ncbi:MAG: FHA domain-containing protein [Planctomycetota bacterium]
MNAKLLVVIGKTTKREVSLQLPAVLGRGSGADVTVAHPLISRHHCEISENNGLLMLHDLGSLNGTMIGGRRIESAPLLPDAEFTIGPLTFHVLYEYDGDLESVPDTRFVEEVEEAGETDLGDPMFAGEEEVPMFEVDEDLPAEPASESDSGELVMPDVLPPADADIEEIPLAAPALPTQAPPDDSTGAQCPPLADDKLPALPMIDVLGEPLDVDSSLQSGCHSAESPWAVEPQSMEKLRHVQAAPAEKGLPAQHETPDIISAEKIAKPPAKKKPTPANPTKRPNNSDKMDPEFGSFLEGLE